MKLHQSGSAYRDASLDGATHIDSLTKVYEALAADLFQAGQALQERKIQQRCAASNHALFLLGHLDTWAEALDDSTLAQGLGQFYAYLRWKIVGLQTKGTRSDFEKLSSLVLEVRSTWQEKSQRAIKTFGEAAGSNIVAHAGEQDRARPVWSA